MSDAARPRPVLILMADDDPEDCLLTKKTLQKARLANELRFVGDGRELLDYLERRGRFADPALSPRPDLILLDLNMPNMSGLGSLWEINLKPAIRRIPIVILTASEDALDVSESYNLGAYAYLVKPVTFGKLHAAVRRLKSYRYELALASGGDAARPAVIVMADDDPQACLLATKALQAAGLRNPLTYVTDGAALMEHVRGRRTFGEDVPAPRPDLVVLDRDMPGRDGRRVLAEIDGDPALRDLPVIVLAAAKDDAGALSGGAPSPRTFVARPLAFDTFAAAIAGFESLAFRLVAADRRDGNGGGAGGTR